MTNGNKRNPLLAEEDWWTVWFGLALLLVATVLGILALSNTISAVRAPKLGKWVSNPTDVFYGAKKTKIKVPPATTAAELAESINANQPKAKAQIVPAEGGVRLRIVSGRTGEGQTISVKTLLTGGKAKLKFSKEASDLGGLGARAYVSQVLPSADLVVGRGHVTVTAQRARSLVVPLLVMLLGMVVLTSIGVRVMGQPVGRYAGAFVVVALRCCRLPSQATTSTRATA